MEYKRYPITEYAKSLGVSRTIIYKLAKKLNRYPTPDEVLGRKNGRPKKEKK